MKLKLLKKHSLYYIIALLIQLTGLLMVLFLGNTSQAKMSIIVMVTFLFTMWALAHHYFHHDLHPRIVIEYVLMGTLGITIMYFVLQ